MLPIQTDELIARVRRFLGITGSSSVGLSETASPVVVLADVNRPPFRQDGVRFWATATQAAVALEFGGVTLEGAALGSLVAVVEKIIISNNTAGALSVRLTSSTAQILATLTVNGFAVVPELGTGTSGGNPVPALSNLRVQARRAGAFVGAFFADLAEQIIIPANSAIQIVDVDIVVTPQLNVGVYCNAVNTPISVSYAGTLHQIRA